MTLLRVIAASFIFIVLLILLFGNFSEPKIYLAILFCLFIVVIAVAQFRVSQIKYYTGSIRAVPKQEASSFVIPPVLLIVFSLFSVATTKTSIGEVVISRLGDYMTLILAIFFIVVFGIYEGAITPRFGKSRILTNLVCILGGLGCYLLLIYLMNVYSDSGAI
jgi:hypothetical protein